MRKEVLYAIIGGVILGLIVAFGVYRVNSKLSLNKKINIHASPTPKPGSGEFKIVLDKPENADVVTENVVTVSGITKPLIWVVISGENSDYIIQSSENGSFSQEVDLIPGVNQIKVAAFNNVGNQGATDVLVVYSSSFQTRTLSTSDKTDMATSTSDIRKKVQEDVANILNHPKAYLGTVTDITDSTIQIKTSASQIEQISVGSQTSVVNSTGTISKQVKVADIGIGDFIVAMGYVDGNSVLSAQRILISVPVTESKINVMQGKLSDIDKKLITKSTKKPNKILDNDQLIYVLANDSKGNSFVRSIFVI